MSTPRRKLVERASPFVLPDCALPGLRGHFSLSAYPLKDEHDAGRRSAKEVKQAAAIAKLYSSEAAVTATRIATQIFGGNGFMEEYPVARFYRDAKILEIGEGTSEVQRMVIGRHLGLPQG